MIGRVEEKKQLQQLLNEEEAQFVAVFGRRRIGKTFLIRESFDYKFTVAECEEYLKTKNLD